MKADFILLPHDLGGTDHTNASTVWPGDDGDWTDHDDFIHPTHVSDWIELDATDGLNWDIWNEPDLPKCLLEQNTTPMDRMVREGRRR